MKPTPLEPRPGLVRALGPLMATAVVVGTVIGSGVFKKPQVVAENVPSFGLGVLIWVAGGILAFLGALALAEVAVLFPKAGGNYVFLREGYGRMAGFLWGWVEFWIIRSASLAALSTIFTESLNDVLRNPAFQEATGWDLGSQPLGYWPQKLLTVGVILGLAVVNMLGVKWGGLLQLFITLVKVSTLVAIAVLPFAILAWVPDATNLPRTANLQPFFPDDWSNVRLAGVGTALLGVLWAYHGWMNIAPIAEEVKNPQRNIPLSLLLGTLIVIVLYVSANVAYALMIPLPEMAGMKQTPVATEFSLRLLGSLGAAAASAAIMCSVFGALNGNLLVGPRLLYAMGEDGLAPKALAAVHPQFRTPVMAILVLATWASWLVLAVAGLTWAGWISDKKSHFDIITDFAMFGAVIFETMAVASIFVFRRTLPDAERPYRCWGYPVVPILYMILPAFVLGNMFVSQLFESSVGLVFIALGVGVYFLIDRGRPAPANRGLETAIKANQP